jgi:predicted nucleic acid-binding protein
VTGIYFDSAYVLKCYLHEADADAVRELMRGAGSVSISTLSIAEVACGFHRHLREGTLNAKTAVTVREQFLEDIRGEVWDLVPLTERILYKVEFLTWGLPHNVYLRAGDAIHVASAMDAGFPGIWTNDRHLLAAAAHLGLKGRQIQARSRS